MAQINSLNCFTGLNVSHFDGLRAPPLRGFCAALYSMPGITHGQGKGTTRNLAMDNSEVVPTASKHKGRPDKQTWRGKVYLNPSLHDQEAHRHLTFHHSPFFLGHAGHVPLHTACPTETNGFGLCLRMQKPDC